MTSQDYIAAIDQGTTSTRCILFDRQGAIVASAQVEHQQIYPRPGWVEHDPLEIWQRTQEVVRRALASAGLRGEQIAAVGITNQRETTVLWDRATGKPFGNALVWQDTRTAGMVAALAEQGGQDRFRLSTGLPLATYFSACKILWILDNVPGARQAAEQGRALFGNIDSWLIWWLTGGPRGGRHVTDVTNASRTQLMNLGSLAWDPSILATLGIPAAILPPIVASSDPDPWGRTVGDGPFGAGIPVCGALGDQQAALVGQCCFSPGDAKNTYGTGCFLLLNTGTERIQSQRGLLTTVAYRLGTQPAVYALEGSIAITGALVQWLRDNLGLIRTAADVESLARTVDDNGGAFFVPAFSGLFAPHWRADARGTIVGLTRYVNKGHLARAALEATAFQTCEVLDAMEQDSGVRLTSLKVDGGMVQNELLMQFQADILGVPVVRPRIAETTALGAAYAAGLAIGLWQSLEELRAQWTAEREWTPAMPAAVREQLLRGWRKAIERSLNWAE
jgi:glycerol kinase